jgi:hypothetical protein
MARIEFGVRGHVRAFKSGDVSPQSKAVLAAASTDPQGLGVRRRERQHVHDRERLCNDSASDTCALQMSVSPVNSLKVQFTPNAEPAILP